MTPTADINAPVGLCQDQGNRIQFGLRLVLRRNMANFRLWQRSDSVMQNDHFARDS